MPTPAEIASLRLFLKKGVIFAAPFLLYAVLIVALDPFNYFGISRLIDNDIKRQTAGNLHNPLWRTLEFLQDPKANVLIGDSRMALLRAHRIKELNGESYYNFAYGGGTIPEMVDTFWFVDKQVELENVFFGVGFVNFNRFQNMNRFTDSAAMLENPALYLTDRVTAKAAYYVVVSQLRGEVLVVDKPPMNMDAFWKYQVGEAIAAHYGRFTYPTEYVDSLREIADYCAEKGIGLTFVIPPSHVDMQRKIDDFGHTELAERFRRDLRSLGRVLDFDFPNEYTRDRKNFKDPVHSEIPFTIIVEKQMMFSDSLDPGLVR